MEESFQIGLYDIIERDDISGVKMVYELRDINDIMVSPSVNKNNEIISESLSTLSAAAFNGAVNTFEFLISNGSDIELKDSKGRTCVHYAAAGGHIEILQFLVNQNAKIDVRDEKGRTAIFYSAAFGQFNTFSWLWANGASINDTDIDGTTLLHCSCLKGSIQIARVLIENGFDINTLDSSINPIIISALLLE